MSLARNTNLLLAATSDTDVSGRTAVEYHLLTWRELYDKSIITADRSSSGSGEWVLRGDRHFYTVTVTSRPSYAIPQELCLFFDCFTETRVFGGGSRQVVGPPIDEIAFEFTTLLSVFVREPILPLGLRRINDRPVVDRFHYLSPPRPDRATPPPAAALDPVEFVPILKGLARAPQPLLDSALAATKFYHAALSLVGFDPSGAYVSLVSAIECLAGHQYKELVFDFKSVDKFQNIQPLLEKIASFPNGKTLAEEIKEELVRSEHFLFQKFALLIANHLPDEFWKTPDELYPHSSVLPPIEQQYLRSCLRRIYDARSAYVHAGTPFPRYVEYGLRARCPADVAAAVGDIKTTGRYLPLFSWFERVTHLVLVEFLRRSLAPELVAARTVRLSEKERLLAVIAALPKKARECLARLTRWTARFVGYSLINPYAPNKEWADEAESIRALLEAGLIGTEGEGMQGASWLKDRDVGEVVGEFFFGIEKNPFRGNELLLPKNWDDLTASNDEDGR